MVIYSILCARWIKSILTAIFMFGVIYVLIENARFGAFKTSRCSFSDILFSRNISIGHVVFSYDIIADNKKGDYNEKFFSDRKAFRN